jgi:hypothetical protein
VHLPFIEKTFKRLLDELYKQALYIGEEGRVLNFFAPFENMILRLIPRIDVLKKCYEQLEPLLEFVPAEYGYHGIDAMGQLPCYV